MNMDLLLNWRVIDFICTSLSCITVLELGLCAMFVGGMECSLAESMDDAREGVVNKLEGRAATWALSKLRVGWGNFRNFHKDRWSPSPALPTAGRLARSTSEQKTLRILVNSKLNVDQPRVCGLYPAVWIQHERLTSWRDLSRVPLSWEGT